MQLTADEINVTQTVECHLPPRCWYNTSVKTEQQLRLQEFTTTQKLNGKIFNFNIKKKVEYNTCTIAYETALKSELRSESETILVKRIQCLVVKYFVQSTQCWFS